MPGITTARSRACSQTSHALIRQLEESWRAGTPVPLDALLPPLPQAAVVCDVACAELELRLRAGDPVDPADYLARYPSLADAVACKVAVVEWDVVIRRELGLVPPPQFADYLRRFPDLRGELERLFGQGGEAAERGMFAPPEKPGEVGRLGRYRVRKEVGRGGMGAVYLGLDPTLGRKVAIKVVLPEYARRASSRERFLREARTAARIRDDHVVVIYDVGEEGGVPFLAMEYLVGVSLERYLNTKGEVGVSQAVRVGREAALGLAAAHQLGVVHRDVKPGNLWLEAPKGRVKLLDFGLARLDQDDEPLTRDGMVVGTPEYMSPEQADGQTADPRSDLFSLGAVMYRLLAGRSPFKRATTMATLKAVCADHPPPVGTLNPDVSAPLAAVVHRLLAKDPGERFQAARAVVDALDALERSSWGGRAVVYVPTPIAISVPSENVWETITTETEGAKTRPEPPPPPASRRRGWAWAAGLATALLFVAATVLAAVLLFPPKGVLVIESDDPDVAVVVKKEGVVVRDRTTDREIPLPAGEYTVELADQRSGVRLKPDRVVITGGGRHEVRVVVAVGPPPPPVDDEREAVRWALEAGGRVWVAAGGGRREVTKADDPIGKVTVVQVDLSTRNRPIAGKKGVQKIAALKRLTELVLSNTDVNDDDLNALAGLPLTELQLAGAEEVTNAGLEHLPTTLTKLNLQGAKRIDDGGMTHLSRLNSLKVLYLTHTGVGDAGLKAVGGLSTLRELVLIKTPVTDAGMAHLGGLSDLEALSLDETRVGNNGVEHLCSMKRLARLFLSSTAVDKGVVVHLRKMPELRVVGLGGAAVNDAFLKQLASLTRLRVLHLTGSAITSEGLEALGALKELTNLYLGDTGVTGQGVKHLTPLKRLEVLELTNAPVGKDAVTHLVDIPSLQKLSLTGEKVILGREDVFELVNKLPDCVIDSRYGKFGPGVVRGATQVVLQLGGEVDVGSSVVKKAADLPAGEFIVKTVWADKKPQFTDSGMAFVGRLTSVETLTISGTPVTDEGLKHLTGCTRLKELYLASLDQVTDKGVEHLRGCPLSILHLSGTGVTDECVPTLLAQTKLSELRLQGCPGVTDAGLINLAGLKSLTTLDVRKTKVTRRGVQQFKAARPGVTLQEDAKE